MDFAQLIDQYARGVETLRRAVAGMTPEQLRARPVAGTWSALEVVAHLADFDPVYADRIKRVIATDRPVYFSAGHEQYLRTLAYHDRDVSEELDLIALTRSQLTRILRTLPPEAADRESIYRSEAGDEPRTLRRLLEIIANHIPHHVKFILDKRRALGLPDPA